ncbi:ATP-binding protein [Desulfonema ishimotonii]|uniref:ATP-binding protein n=1 Tax=Desulfonema ishimotonii TaxID=45657 RepID=A0A401FWF6_9BACT|nr:ATP-binding protein [Desulfonema ishimotonii]GBC61291.1 ATP-binding protein [Desulfonema ishimotonii]
MPNIRSDDRPDGKFDPEIFAEAYRNLDISPLGGPAFETFAEAGLTEEIMRRLHGKVAASERFQKILFVGHGGCGKSTVLARLARDSRLSEQHYVSMFSLGDDLNFMDAEAIDILFSLYCHLLRMLRDKGFDPPLADFEKQVAPVTERFGTEIRGFDLMQAISEAIRSDSEFREALRKVLTADAESLQANVSGVCDRFSGNSYNCFKINHAVLDRLREEDVSDNVIEKLKEIRDREFRSEMRFIRALKARIGDIQEIHYEPVILKHAWVETPREALILIDDMDKLKRGSAERIFFEQSHLLTFPRARIVFTFPLSVYYSPLFFHIRDHFDCVFIHPLQLYDMTGNRREDAWAAMRSLLRRRMGRLRISEAASDLLIEYSGGLLRTLIGLARQSCRIAMARRMPGIDRAVAEMAVTALAGVFTRFFDGAEYGDVVRKITDVKSKAGMANRDLIYLLRYAFVLEYENPGEPAWYDAHPCLKMSLSGKK